MENALLVIDDDDGFRAIVRRAAAHMTLPVVELVNVRDVRRWVDVGKSGGGSGMVVDVVLPDGTGFDALEVLRPVVGRLPTFIVTGDGDAGLESRARAQQAWFARKPLPSRMLEAFISTLVRSPAAGTIFMSKSDAAHRLATLAGLWDSERDLLIAALELSTSHAALAERLGIGPRAVRERIGGVLEKLDACSLAQLICDIESAADGRGPYAHWLAD